VTEVYGACAVAAESIGGERPVDHSGWRAQGPMAAPGAGPVEGTDFKQGGPSLRAGGHRRVRRVVRRYRRAIMRRVRPTVADRRPLTPGAEQPTSAGRVGALLEDRRADVAPRHGWAVPPRAWLLTGPQSQASTIVARPRAPRIFMRC
jgi:hypothetical protein